MQISQRTCFAVNGSVDDAIRALLDAVQTLEFFHVTTALQRGEVRRQLGLELYRRWYRRRRHVAVAVVVVVGLITAGRGP